MKAPKIFFTRIGVLVKEIKKTNDLTVSRYNVLNFRLPEIWFESRSQTRTLDKFKNFKKFEQHIVQEQLILSAKKLLNSKLKMPNKKI